MAASAACTPAAPSRLGGLSRISASSVPRYPERVRALLIVNPRATSTTQLRREVITHALASQMDLEVVQTRYRGHAAGLAAAAAADGHELVLTLGGDGTVNEAVNGLLLDAEPGPGAAPRWPRCPAATPTCSPGRSGCPPTRWMRPGG